MTTATTTLTEFLLARIAEDEEAARAAIDPELPGAEWLWFNDDDAPSVPDPDTSGEYLTGPTSLRTVEEFATAYVGNLPAFAVCYAEEVKAGVADHIARHDPARVLAECKAKRAIVELHKAWPVLVQQPAELTHDAGPTDLSSLTFRMTQRMDWLTAQQYRERFGEEPPTAPMLAALAAIYADHPDYRPEWTVDDASSRQ